jgi:hypothetical protein
MSWTRATAYWLVAGLLLWAYVALQPRARGGGDVEVARQASRSTVLSVDPETVESVELKRGDATIAWQRKGRGWELRLPTGKAIPVGLLEAFVDQLGDAGRGEELDGSGTENAYYGLEEPSFVVTVRSTDREPITLVVGARTPTKTASYARVQGSKPVLVVGLNLTYYADLMFDAVR